MKRAIALILIVALLCASILLYQAAKPTEVEADYTWNIDVLYSDTYATLLEKDGSANCAQNEVVWLAVTDGYCPGASWVVAVNGWQGTGTKNISWADLGLSPTVGQTCCMKWKCPNTAPPPSYWWGNDHETIVVGRPTPGP